MRRLLTALLGAAAITAGLSAAAPALASTAHPAAHSAPGTVATQVNPTNLTKPYTAKVSKAPQVGQWIICTRSGTKRCLTSEGNGNIMEIKASGYSTFNRTSPSGSAGFLFTTPNGLCVHGTDPGGQQNGAVTAVTGSCGAGNTASQWDEDNSSPSRLFNVTYVTSGGNNLYISTAANSDGENVYLNPGSGSFYLSPGAS